MLFRTFFNTFLLKLPFMKKMYTRVNKIPFLLMYINFMNFTKWRMKYIYYIITEYMVLNLIKLFNIVWILAYLIFMLYQTILSSPERLSSKSAGLYCMHININFCPLKLLIFCMAWIYWNVLQELYAIHWTFLQFYSL